LPQHETAREGGWPAKMLVRALKVLRFFPNETTRTDIATAALDQPGDLSVGLWQNRTELATMNRGTRSADEWLILADLAGNGTK
jgi:hypothetical protein